MFQPTDHSAVTDLHVCGTCSSPLVQPVDCQRLSTTYWQVELRCPECEWRGSGVYSEAELAALEAEMERATNQLVADLVALTER